MRPDLLQLLLALLFTGLLTATAAPTPAPPYAWHRRAATRAVTPGHVGAAADSSGGVRAVRRGTRTRRRGSRGGRIWRTHPVADQLYVAHLNIRSLNPSLLELRHDLDTHKPDIISLNETWLRPSQDSRTIPIPGYQLFRRDRSGGGRRASGGVAVAVRAGLRVTEVPISDRPAPGSKLESLWVRVGSGERQLYFCSLYRPPRQAADDVTSDLDDLQEQLETVTTRHNGIVIIAGDVNIDMGADSTAKRRFCQMLDAFSLRQHVTGPTFRSSGSVIDVICSNGELRRQGTLHCDYSDHNWARATFNLAGLRPKPTVLTARSWRRANAAELNRRLEGIDWSPVYHSADPAEQWEYFLSVTRPVLNEAAPLKRTRVRNPTAPPVTEATKQLMAERRAALRGGDRDLYRQLNRSVRAAIRGDTRDAVQRHIRERGPASLWRAVQPVVAGKRASQPPITADQVDVDALNKYFAEIGVKTSRTVDRSGPELHVRLPRVSSGSFQLTPVTPGYLHSIVLKMNGSSACGADGLCVKFIKMCIDSLCHVLTHIVNSSITSCVVPDSWKLTLVHPIPKATKTGDFSCYRPISILTTIAKITERIVSEQLYTYFTTHHLFSANQHGFRTNHSTDTALLTLTDHVFRAMDRREITLLCLIDCSRCFDCIPHGALLRKLELYGVDTKWFESYLVNHYQRVQIPTSGSGAFRERVLSKPLLNPIGTFQGSSLGPLMHNIYANDLPLYTDESTSIIAYADDVQLYVSGPPRDLSRVIQTLEHSLAVVSNWYGNNGLKINAAKTQLIALGTRELTRRLPSISISFSGASVTCSNTVKNLGVWFDSDMSFVTHTNDVIRRCTGSLCGLSHSRHSLPQSVLIPLVQGLVLSVLRYCLSVYGASNATQRSRLQKIVRFAARVVSGRRKYDHVSDVLDDLGWLHVDNMYKYRYLTLVRKMLDTSEPLQLAGSLATRQSVHDRDTRQSGQLLTPSIRSESGRRRFSYTAVSEYNGLPHELRSLSSARFARGLREYLWQKQHN